MKTMETRLVNIDLVYEGGYVLSNTIIIIRNYHGFIY
jgi:hypothetical protein